MSESAAVPLPVWKSSFLPTLVPLVSSGVAGKPLSPDENEVLAWPCSPTVSELQASAVAAVEPPRVSAAERLPESSAWRSGVSIICQSMSITYV